MTISKTYSKAASWLLAVVMMFGMLFSSAPTVLAANEGTLNIHKLSSVGVASEVQDPLKTYYQNPTDSLYYEYLAGAKYTLYKIGTFSESNVGGTVSTVYTADPNVKDSSNSTITLSSSTVPGDIDLANSITAGLTGIVTNATTATGALSITSGLDTNGVYLIVESTLPSGVSAGADFIITVPMYNAAASSWDYTVNAYPKNTASTGAISKTVTQVDGSAVTGTGNTFYGNIGSTITYAATVTVPNDYTTSNADSAKNYSKFDIIDSSSPYLELDYTTNPEDGVTIIGSTSGAFTAVTDYTAAYSIPGGEANNVLTVKFTAAGLAKIQAGETLTVSYDAEIQAGAAVAAGALTNKAWIEFTKGTGSGTILPPPTDPPATVKIYSYGVKKMNDAAAPAPLEGAEFVLATKDGTGGYQYLSYNTTTETWSVVAETSAQVFITSTSGSGINSEAILQFKNLDPDETYYLIEKTAPTGYIKLLNPIVITATDNTTDAVYNTYDTSSTYVADTGYSVKVTNVSTANGGIIGGGGLPATGGDGIYLYLIFGAVLMGSALVFYIRLRRKSKVIQ